MKLLAQGAEANIYERDNVIIKDRFLKKYRHPQLDETLRQQRTNKEAKVLKDLHNMGFTPQLIKKSKTTLIIEKVHGTLLRNCLDSEQTLIEQVAKHVALLHNQNIIHGDLTTSNMMVHEHKVYIIDFGLSIHTTKIEDKAVDLHVFEEALESQHATHYNAILKLFVNEYINNAHHAHLILDRLALVRKRGRNKTKG